MHGRHSLPCSRAVPLVPQVLEEGGVTWHELPGWLPAHHSWFSSLVFAWGYVFNIFWCATPCAGPCKPRSGRHPRGPSSWSVVQKEVLVLCLLHPGNCLTFLLPVSPLHVLWCRGLIAFFISWKVEDWNYILNL